MLSNRLKIDNQEYTIREGTYTKKKIEPTISRFGVGDLALSDLTRWNFFSQSLWHGGASEKFLSVDDVTKFMSSENVDVYDEIGSIKLARSLDVSASLTGFTAPVMTNFYDGGQYRTFIGNAAVIAGNPAMQLYRYTGGVAALSAAYVDASAGQIHALQEYAIGNNYALMMGTNGGAGGNSGRLKEYTAFDTVANVTAFNESWTPQSMVQVDNTLYILGTDLMSYVFNGAVTSLKTNIELTGTKNQNSCEVNGDIYWIGSKNGRGRLWKYTISTDTSIIVKDFKDELEPEFCINYNNKVVFGGKNWQTLAASIWEWDPLNQTMTNIKKFANTDDEDNATNARVHKGICYIGINGDAGPKQYIWAYDGVSFSNFLTQAKQISTIGFLGDRMVSVGAGNAFKSSTNPNSHQASGVLDSSKIDFGLFGVDKYIGGITVEHEPLAANETASIKARIDSNVAFSGITQLGYNSSVGSTSFDVELLSSNIGKKLEYQIKLKGVEAATTTPKINDVVMRYLLNPTPKFEWTFDLLLIDEIDNQRRKWTAEQLTEKLTESFDDLIVELIDIDGVSYSVKKDGTADRGIIFDGLELLGPYNRGQDKVEYIARCHLLEG